MDIEKIIEALEAEARYIVDNQGNPIGKCIDIERAVEIVRAGSSPVGVGKVEKFGEIDGHSIYVVRDEYGRIVVSDELFKELIERYNNDKTGNT